ncbi:hypothetical protein AURDEDRAFT_163425 [Auricularia subglabra TFB-10046 SS5]|nr:hypothetical protein AURDEDRAFT_163425 [Auricularia subglabra TFB-10046 SS5]
MSSETAHSSLEAAELSELSETTGTSSPSPPPDSQPEQALEQLPSSDANAIVSDGRAQSSAPARQPRLVIRIPSLAARRALAQSQSNSPPSSSAATAPAPRQRPRSPTPDSEEDDFAANFMRKRTVAAALR